MRQKQRNWTGEGDELYYLSTVVGDYWGCLRYAGDVCRLEKTEAWCIDSPASRAVAVAELAPRRTSEGDAVSGVLFLL